MKVLNPELYTVAWIAPLEIEARAALGILDNHHDGVFPLSPGDDYLYQAGEVCGHNVIIATFPDDRQYGTGAAAALASHVKKFFPKLWLHLLVGVAAGLPNLHRNPSRDIRLGDVLVAAPEGDNAGLIAYDLGKETDDNGFQPLRHGHILAPTKTVILSAMKQIKLSPLNETEILLPYYEKLESNEQHNRDSFADPGQANDVFFDIDNQGNEYQVSREPRPNSRRVRVWYGTIGTGDKLIKSACKRNQLRDKYNVIGLEMEAAGTMNCIPAGVIRGVCDYGDSHKNKEWQPYAAAMAACYAKAVLARIRPKVSMQLEVQIMQHNPISEMPNRPKRPLDNSSSFTESRFSKSSRREDSNTPFLQTSLVQQEHLDSDRTQTILQSLAFNAIYSRYHTIEGAYKGTCEWLSTTPQFLAWLDPNRLVEHHGFLWIKGNPGAGKSTLMKFALQVAQESKQSNCISFFFNACGDDLEKSTTGMYRSLLFQVLTKIPRLQHVLSSLGQTIRNENIPQQSTESIKSLFKQAIENLDQSSLTCFIDALDECDNAYISEMITFFEGLGKMAVSRNIVFRVCLSSRHCPSVSISKSLYLELDRQRGHREDMIDYVKGNLTITNTKLAQQVQQRLIQKASGVFIWVVLVIKILHGEQNNGYTHLLLQKVEEIPEDLNGLLQNILTRDNRHRTEMLLCIQWVLFAKKPLRKEQLYLAIRAGVDSSVISTRNPDEMEDAYIRRFIIGSSKGLVKSGADSTVQFIHDSVREFFTKGYFTRLWPEFKENFRGKSHERLKQCCFNYIMKSVSYVTLENGLSREWIEKKFPLLEYSFQNVLLHAEEAAASGVDQESFLQNFDLDSWFTCQYICEHFTLHKQQPTTSLLYILAEHDAGNLIGYHKEKLNAFKEEHDSRYRMPILAAIANNSHKAVYALLKAQADTELPTSILHKLCKQYLHNKSKRTFTMHEFKYSTNKKSTPVSNLINTGEDVVVCFLLATPPTLNTNIERGAAVNTRVLRDAAAKGREALVRQLLDQDIDVNGSYKFEETALYHAIRNGHLKVVQLLLDRHAKVDITGYPEGTTYLHLAVKTRSKAMVQLLLLHGSNVNASATNGDAPLHIAVAHGYRSIVQLLIDKNASIEAVGKQGFTPLLLAAHCWEFSIVQILLENGANVAAADDMGRTPLAVLLLNIPKRVESWQNTEAIIQRLLYQGADINSPDKEGSTPLSLITALPDNDPIKRLVLTERSAEGSTHR